MSPVNEPSNIVDFGQRQDPRNERVGNLLAAVQRISARRLQALADSMFEQVDDALFDLAEKAESNAVQTQYFDGMREVRKKRALTERRFLEQVARGLTGFAAGQPVSAHADAAPAASDSHGELSLVDDTELEESLAIASMISKTQGRLSRALYAVNQRLSVICGGNRIEDAGNPVGPAMLCQAFRLSMRGLTSEMRVKLIIYKLFDRYVMAGLDTLYDEINAELVQAGVLPQLRHEIPGQRRGRSSPAAAAAARIAGGSDGGAEAGDYSQDYGTDEFQAEFLHVLNNLLAARRSGGSGGQASRGGMAAHGSMASLSPAELLGALSLLQNEVAVNAPEVDDAQQASVPTRDVARLKDQLLQQIGRLRGDTHTRMSGADEDTIDLVGMLFEFILQDRNLPAEMQVLLARLQIPYLKAAILDRRMFAHTSHPARRLLDSLADAAKGWSEESDRDRRLYSKVQAIVDSLLQEFDDDLGIFARLEDELLEFLATSRKRADLSEQRVAEAARGREKLQQARRRAAQEILARVGQHPLPELVHGILTRAWANYLVLTLLRQSEDSQEFRVALRFVDDFVWSALPKHDEAERQRLRQLLPLLEKSLRHGLATVAFQDTDVENLMTQLNALYRVQLGEAEPETAQSVSTVRLPIPDSIEVIAAPEVAAEETPAQTASATDDPNLQRVRALKVGNWVEFAVSEGSGERAKLSWISPISGKYLFVNRRGLKVADKTVQQLTAEFAAGTTVALEELPLFDRALDAIVERLRKTQAEREHDASAPPAANAPGTS